MIIKTFRIGIPSWNVRNPYLKNGDIIVVGKGALNAANEVITEVTAPIQGLVNGFAIYKFLINE